MQKSQAKKMLAIVLSVLLLISSIPLVSAAAAVSTITLKAYPGITYIAEDGLEVDPDYNADYEAFGYQFTREANGDFTVTPVSGQSAIKSFKFTLEIDPSSGIEGVSPTADNGAKVTKPVGAEYYSINFRGATDAHITVDPQPSKASHTVTLPADGTGYRIQSSGNTVEDGGSFSFQVVVDDGYTVTSVKANNLEVSGSKNGNTYTYTLENVKANQNVSVSVSAPHVVILPSGEGYTASSTMDPSAVPHGGTFTFTVEAQEGYGVPVVKANGVVLTTSQTGSPYQYSIGNVTRDQTVTVSLEKSQYSVSFAQAIGYTITPASGTIEHGGTFNFYVVPQPGYAAPEITASNGTVQSLDNNTLYQLSGVTANTTITVKAVKTSHTVTLNPGANYSITGTDGAELTTQSVEDGSAFSFKVSADAAYRIVSVTSSNDGVLKAADGVYTLPSVKKDTTVSVVVAKKTFTITEPAQKDTAEYTYTANASTTVDYDGSFSFYVIPKSGFQAPVVMVDGTAVASSGNNLYTINNITSNKAITVTAGTAVSYSVTLNQGAGYTITPVAGTTVEHGKDFQFTVALDAQYSQSSITVTANNVAITPVDGVYTIQNVTANQVVSVSGVAKNTYSVTLVGGEGYTLSTTQFTTGISHGSEFRFSLNVAQGYDGTNALVSDGANTLTAKDGYYSVTVTGNTTITVTGITRITSTVTLPTGESFEVLPTEGSTSPVVYGGSYGFTISVKPGYHLDQVVVNNAALSPLANGEYHINNITAAQNVQVFVSEVTYTVQYVDTIGADTADVAYHIGDAVDATGKVILKVPAEQQYYRFDGWFDEKGAQVTEITLGNTDESINLVARWTPLWDKIVTLVTEATQKPGEGSVTHIIYSMGIQIAQIFATQDAKITGCGILYSNRELTQDELAQRVANITDRDTMDQKIQQNVGEKVLAYYYNTNYNVGDLTLLNQTFQGVKNGSYRSECGWVELTVNGEKMVFFSNISNLTAGQAV